MTFLARLFRRLRRHRPHPIEERRTIDYDELCALWPFDNGAPE